MTTSEHVLTSSALRRMKSNIVRRERRRYKHRLQAVMATTHAPTTHAPTTHAPTTHAPTTEQERDLEACAVLFNNTIIQFVHVIIGLLVLAYARDLRTVGQLVTCLVVWSLALYAMLTRS